MKGYQNFFFSNGKSIEGGYDNETGKFHGLSKFSSIFGMQDFSSFNLMLSTYEDSGITTVSFFDDYFVEHLFPGTPISSGMQLSTVSFHVILFLKISYIWISHVIFSVGLNGHNPIVRYRIEITVQHHHLYKYVYGVVRYKIAGLQ